MSQENIWSESLNEEVESKVSSSIIIKRNFPYELTDIDLRNYLNTHSVNDISVDSIYDYFKDNMFRDYNGLYLPHMLISVPYIPRDKIFKALEEVFKVVSPNVGSKIDKNYNYFQYYMLIWRKLELTYIQYMFKELYELGLKYGLDKCYYDNLGHSNLYYYFASAPIKDIEKNWKLFFSGHHILYGLEELEILGHRFVTSQYSSTSKLFDTYAIFNELCREDDVISENIVYYGYKELSNGTELSNEYKIYEKIKTLAKELK